MHIEDDSIERQPVRRRAPEPDMHMPPDSAERVRRYPFRETNTLAALAHCELSTRPGDERLDCPLKALARRLIQAEGEWIADIREDEAAAVMAVFGVEIEWKALQGSRWTGFWTVPLPAGGEVQDEVKAFEQFLAGRPEPKAMKVAADSIRRVAALISGYLADIAAHAARPAPWNEPEPEPVSPRHGDVTEYP